MFKILILRNAVPYLNQSDFQKTVDFFKTRIPFPITFEVKDIQAHVSIHKYKTVQAFSPITGKPANIGYWGLDDYVKDSCRNLVKEGEYQMVIFVWDLTTVTVTGDNVITSWTNYLPLYQGTEFIQLAIDTYLENKGDIWHRISHEMMHAFNQSINRKLLSRVAIIDPMDSWKQPNDFVENDNPESLTGNYTEAIKRLTPYWALIAPTSPVTSTSTPTDISTQGLNLIAAFEGLRLAPYTDSIGIWTIGYGATYDLTGHKITATTPHITQTTALLMLHSSVSTVVSFIKKVVTKTINQHQFDACCSLAYNVGVGNFQKSNLLKNINSGKPVVPNNFLSWNKAGGKVIAGLTNRRQKEYNLFIS